MSTQAIICVGLLVALAAGVVTGVAGVGAPISYLILIVIVAPMVWLVVGRQGGGSNGMSDFERRLAPFYPVFIAVGVLFFIVGTLSGSVVQRVIALVWLGVVPLWAIRYRAYRRGATG